MDITKMQNDVVNRELQNFEGQIKQICASDYVSDEDYFRCSDLSATSESELNDLLLKMNISKSRQQRDNKIFTVKNDFSKNDFEVNGYIGKGSYAQVLKARRISNNTVNALKVVDKNLISKQGKLYQVFLENEVLKILDHPNIIKHYGIFEENEKIYTVLEYCSAGDFQEFILNNCKIILIKFLFNLKLLSFLLLKSLKLLNIYII